MPTTTQTQEQTSQTTNNNTNINDEFLQWWIDKAGVGAFDESKGFYRTDAMSDYDYRIGKNLYTGYQNKQNLEKEYLTAQEQLKKQTAQAQAQSYAEKVLMQKYLPELLNVQGYSGNVGLTEDAVLGLNRNYNNSLNTLQSNYQDNLNDLTNDYNANRLSIDNSVNDRNDSIYDLMKAKEEQEQLNWYNNLQSNIADMLVDEDVDYEQVNEYLDKYKDRLSQSQYEMLKENINYQNSKDNKENTKQDFENFVSGKGTIQTQDGKNVIISENGQSQTSKDIYNFIDKVQSRADLKLIFGNIVETPDQQLKSMGYTGLFDKNIKDGTTVTLVTNRKGTKIYAGQYTYVDGSWYLTKYI